jgi:hypothetical protein
LLELEDDALDEAIAKEVQKHLDRYFKAKQKKAEKKAAAAAEEKKADEERDKRIYLELKQRFG